VLKELKTCEAGNKPFLSMGVSAYNDVLQIANPFTEKEDIVMINAIP
jgi:hypothetical protein